MGGNRTIRLDVRIVAATNRDLKAMVDENMLRADLYYRLAAFPLNFPLNGPPCGSAAGTPCCSLATSYGNTRGAWNGTMERIPTSGRCF